jgi:hypothetical protein
MVSMIMPRPALSEADLAFFAENHYVALDGCVPRRLVERFTTHALSSRGIDPDVPSTWPKTGHAFLSRIKPATWIADMRDFAPRAWDAACQLVGGEERVSDPVIVCDDLIMNFDLCADQPWQEPSSATGAWHVDGDFNHFLDSPEFSLLGIILFTDVVERGGPTWIANDSIAPVARALREHPRGLSAFDLRTKFEFQRECQRFMPLTGPAGRIYLMHPLMLHCVAWNPLRRVRAIRNFGVRLKEPMRFDPSRRPLSPIEAATMRALGVDRLDFTPPPAELRGPTDHDTGVLLPPTPRKPPAFNLDAAALARIAEGSTPTA